MLGPVIEYDYVLPWLLTNFHSKDKNMTHSNFEKQKFIDDRMLEIVISSGPEYYSILNAICLNKTTCIHNTDKDEPLQFDYGHLTKEGASFLLRKIGVLSSSK